MKKKTLCAVLGMVAILASCGQEELASGQGGKAMTITANLDNSMGTRASTYDNDDVEIDQCLMEIYDEEGNLVGTQVEGTKGSAEGQFTFTVAGLDPDVPYDFVFWADNKEAAAYTGDLKNRQLSASADLGKALAFQGKIENSLVENATTVTLTHAVAKISLKTTGAMSEGDKVDMSVKTATNTWNVLNASVTGSVAASYSYTLTQAIPENQEGSEVTTFYVPAPTEGTVSDLDLTFTKTGEEAEATTITNVPLKANYRTLLKGNVAMINTVSANVTASLNDEWSDQESGEILVPASNTIVTTKAGEITADKVQRAANFNNNEGKIVVIGPVNDADLTIVATAGATTVKSLDLNDAILMNGESETTVFGNYFQGNKTLESIVLPSNITEIGDNAFRICTNLANIELPFRLEKIGTYAFDGTKIKKFVIEENLKEIGASAFSFTQLEGELIIPAHVKSVGNYAFDHTNITSVVWNSDANLAYTVLGDCKKLTTVVINGNVTSINKNAFDRSNLTLILNINTPPEATEGFLSNMNLTAIYVPADAVDTYKAAEGWKEHADIIQAIPAGE